MKNFVCLALIIFCSGFTIGAKVERPLHQKYYEKGMQAYRDGYYRESERNFRKALSYKKEYKEAQLGLGNVLRDHAIKLMKESEEAYQEALHLDPNYGDAIEELSLLYLERGEFRRADEGYHLLVELDRDESARVFRQKLKQRVDQAKRID